jgi:signal transduction histidine kinase
MYADQIKVRQILLNVLGNATKFTEHGSITLRISAENGESDATLSSSGAQPAAQHMPAVVTFQITDTGIGMTPEQQQQLFKEFVQVHNVATQKYGGSGLGLAISRRLCRLMGGGIRVISELGQGSTFTVQLPIRAAEPTVAASATDEDINGQAQAPTYEPQSRPS